jgi:4-amino-4-deoxy-L-arabinose transferase-like glycosyltransferase
LLFAVVAVFYIGTTGFASLLGKDEPRYVAIAREMWLRGDWVTPTLGGPTWFEKPALLYWMIIASFKVFGASEWSARLGPALCGLATVALVYWVARRVERENDENLALQGASAQSTASPYRTASPHSYALWSAAAMASCVGLMVFSHGATFDIVLTATITFALACFFVSELEDDPARRRKLLAGLWVGVGLSLIAKGLIGMLLPGGIVFLYFMLRRDWRGLLRIGMPWGIPLAILVSATWYGPVIAQHGKAFIDEFFVQHHFQRYTSNKYLHAKPVYYFVPVIGLFVFPWIAFLLVALREVKPANWNSGAADSKLRVFAFSWLLFPFLFFSFSGSKLTGYIMPAIPGAILLAAIPLVAYVRGQSGVGRARVTGLFLSLLAIALLVYAQRSGKVPVAGAMIVALPLGVAGLFALLQAQRRELCAVGIIGAMFLSVTLLTCGAVPPLLERGSMRAMLRVATERGYGNERVLMMETKERTAEYYAAGRLLYDANGEPTRLYGAGQVWNALPPSGSALVLLPLSKIDQLINSSLQTTMISDNGAIALVRVQKPGAGVSATSSPTTSVPPQ